jgi:hypothetical protein
MKRASSWNLYAEMDRKISVFLRTHVQKANLGHPPCDEGRLVLTDRAQGEVGGAEGVVFWGWRNVPPDLWSGLLFFGVCFRVAHS